MREFNTLGPVNPREHYHVNRVAVKAAMRAKIKKGRYFTLNAGRQTGKTTLFREVMAELAADEGYFGILVSFETLRGYGRRDFYYWLQRKVYESMVGSADIDLNTLAWLETTKITDHNSFGLMLSHLCQRVGRRGVLIIDEFDAVAPRFAELILSVLREMYLRRDQPALPTLHSVILVGVRNIPSLLGGTQSPFNIAEQFTVPYFTPDEVADLLSQHTAETGQVIAPMTVSAIFLETEGQPFLVNRLGQLLTQDIVPARNETIQPTHLNYALALLLRENNTHFASIVSKATPHRAVLLPTLLYDERRTDFLDPVTQDLIMYGVLREVEEEPHLRVARVANPIYRKMLLLRFSRPSHDLQLNGAVRNRYLHNGALDFDGLLDSFHAFMREHGVRLLRSEASGRPLEISGQYLLLSYLTAALNTVGGLVTIESLSSAGEIDLLAFYQGQRFIIETKIWYGPAAFGRAKTQLAAYVRAASLPTGYLVIFDENVMDNPLRADHGEVFEANEGDERLRVYLIGVRVG